MRILRNFLLAMVAVIGVFIVSLVIMVTVNETLGRVVMFGLIFAVLIPLGDRIRGKR